MNTLDWFLNVRGTRGRWQALLVALDAIVIMLATVTTYLARFEGSIPVDYSRTLPWVALLFVAVYLAAAWLFGLYQVVLRYVGVDTLLRSVGAVASGAAVLVAGDLAASFLSSGQRPIPLGVILIQGMFTFTGIAGIRMTVRAGQHIRMRGSRGTGDRLLIVGAGDAGSLLLRELYARPELEVDVVGFLDDDPTLSHSIVGGVRVLGTTDELEMVVREYEIDQLFVALPSASDNLVRGILNRAADLDLTTRIMPKLVIEKGRVRLSDMRKVDVEDLLGRELTPIDVEQVAATLAGRVVAVTGAAGSIGSELCRQVMRMSPAKLLLLEIDESRLYELWLELDARQGGVAEMHILDIRDQEKVESLLSLHRPDVVIHAAAYKHVPLMELEPSEAVRTNVIGTNNVINAAIRNGVERFVLISTDKAVAPSSVMGKTKEICERLMLAAARSQSDMKCIAVRFGNVLGSRGSVVPIFEEKLLRGEPLTVTDPEVSRYFMMIPEAARLVLQAQAIGTSGDIFVLEMGEPVRIVDLARKMIALSGVPADIVFTGLRPGEKLHEVLHTCDEELVPTEREKILRISRFGVMPMEQSEYENLRDAALQGRLTAEQVLGIQSPCCSQ